MDRPRTRRSESARARRTRSSSARGAGAASGRATLRAFQARIEALYGARDRARGLAGTFMWLVEEVGELSRALRKTERSNIDEELADVLAWLASVASLAGADLEQAARKYARGCPRCRATPCACQHRSGANPTT